MMVTPTSKSTVSNVRSMVHMQISPVIPQLPWGALPGAGSREELHTMCAYVSSLSLHSMSFSPQCQPCLSFPWFFTEEFRPIVSQTSPHSPCACFLAIWLGSATCSRYTTGWCGDLMAESWQGGGRSACSALCDISWATSLVGGWGEPFSHSIKRVPFPLAINNMRCYFWFMWMTLFSNHHHQSFPDWMKTVGTMNLYFPTSVIIPTFSRCRSPEKTNYSSGKSSVSSSLSFS